MNNFLMVTLAVFMFSCSATVSTSTVAKNEIYFVFDGIFEYLEKGNHLIDDPSLLYRLIKSSLDKVQSDISALATRNGNGRSVGALRVIYSFSEEGECRVIVYGIWIDGTPMITGFSSIEGIRNLNLEEFVEYLCEDRFKGWNDLLINPKTKTEGA